MIVTVIIVSFLLDGVLSNLISINSLFVPFFSLVCLLVLYPYFNGNIKNFITVSALVGLFYDIIYTDSIFVNTFAFLALSLFIVKINEYVNSNILNICNLSVIIIFIYRVFSYLILCMVGYSNFDFNTLIRGIYSSLIINVLYTAVLFKLTNYLCEKYKLKRIK